MFDSIYWIILGPRHLEAADWAALGLGEPHGMSIGVHYLLDQVHGLSSPAALQRAVTNFGIRSISQRCKELILGCKDVYSFLTLAPFIFCMCEREDFSRQFFQDGLHIALIKIAWHGIKAWDPAQGIEIASKCIWALCRLDIRYSTSLLYSAKFTFTDLLSHSSSTWKVLVWRTL